MINGKKFAMQRIDLKQDLMNAEYWDVTNTNDKVNGMLHPFHIHGAHFLVVSRNGEEPYPNEKGVYKDTVEVAPQETVRLKVYFQNTGVFMYHCHIIEHEDAGMMAQIQIVDPKDPDKTYELMDMETLTKAFSEEKGIPMDEVYCPGMDTEGMAVKGVDHSLDALSGASHSHHEEHHEEAPVSHEEPSHEDATSGASHH